MRDKRSLQYIKKFAVTLKKLRGTGSGGEDGGHEQGRVGEREGEGEGEGVREDKREGEGEEEGDREDEEGGKDDTLVASTPPPHAPPEATGETKTKPLEGDRDEHIPNETLLVSPNPTHITASNAHRTTASKTTRETAKSQGILLYTVTDGYR